MVLETKFWCCGVEAFYRYHQQQTELRTFLVQPQSLKHWSMRGLSEGSSSERPSPLAWDSGDV